MKKKIVSIKLDESEVLALQKKADLEGKSVTDYIKQGMRDSERIAFLEAKLKDIESRTGVKPRTEKRISVPFTLMEYEAIRQAAHSSRISSAQYLRRAIVGKQNQLELPVVR